jgi:4-alpha-glucanotransferase
LDNKLRHNSQSQEYRSPFGAAPCGTDVRLRIQASRGLFVNRIVLRCHMPNHEDRVFDMERCSGENYEVTLTAEQVGLMWYYFQIYLEDGSMYYYGNNDQQWGGWGKVSDQPPKAFQITVYDPSFVIPEWYSQGVMYQIFVDRFRNGCPDGKILHPKPGAMIHAHWEDTPFYIRNTAGAIRRWDFFGGNLEGVIQKLPYLKGLGVSILYLNPIFEAPSNHKYDTGNYKNVDPMFGNGETFARLCEKAAEAGIHVMLDGVFSHTGSDSVYFNREGHYPGPGAYQSKESPYYSWYRFTNYPTEYESWWGFGNLPNVDEDNPDYQNYIFGDEDSVIRSWMRMGAKGWRLDVADELPDDFIAKLKAAMRETDPDSVLLGEVWEDASNKVSYGRHRAYLYGYELDSVMNYPFRKILLEMLLGRRTVEDAHRELMSLYENYPRSHFYAAMNLIGGHDTPRILTLLGEGAPPEHLDDDQKETTRLFPDKLELGKRRLKLAALFQMTFPGVPCIYYGDEAGAEGYADPYNRGAYPWGKEDRELIAWYKTLASLRRSHEALIRGDWVVAVVQENVYGYWRESENEKLLILLNRHSSKAYDIRIPADTLRSKSKRKRSVRELISGDRFMKDGDGYLIYVPALEGRILIWN